MKRNEGLRHLPEPFSDSEIGSETLAPARLDG